MYIYIYLYVYRGRGNIVGSALLWKGKKKNDVARAKHALHIYSTLILQYIIVMKYCQNFMYTALFFYHQNNVKNVAFNILLYIILYFSTQYD